LSIFANKTINPTDIRPAFHGYIEARLRANGLLQITGALAVALIVSLAGCGGMYYPPTASAPKTATPIQHVIIVIGENRSFDNLFATYVPPDPTQHVENLLSEGIVKADGSPGPNFAVAAQQQAVDSSDDAFLISPPQTGPYTTLPQPSTTVGPRIFAPANIPPYLTFIFGPAITSDAGLLGSDQNLLTDGGIDPLIPLIPDTRFPANLPSGPFPVTKYVTYPSTIGDPMHRFYQMWQQIDCSAATMSASNPSGCMHDLYPWTAVTVGWGPIFENTAPPAQFTDQTTWMGGVSMGFYNMAAGDVPYLASLANQYTLADNYHQFILGGTGPNSISTGTADALIYRDANGTMATPIASQVENPDAYAGSNNWYQQEGFALKDPGNTSNASYTNCSDPTQPGVKAIMNYLNILPYKPFRSGNCAAGAYYLLNNQYPAYQRDGSLRPDQTYTVGPSLTPTIGDELSAAGISWKYYGEGFDNKDSEVLYSHYCDICNPFQYSKSIMTTKLRNNIQSLADFYNDLQNGTLPAVSYVKPDDLLDMHPGSSMPVLFEGFVRKVVTSVQAQSALYKTTVIFITTDESGGTYDSGYIQPIDFFGDGPRIPLIAISPYAKPGYIDHTYGDHASLMKFIEANWKLKPLSPRSRDNLPNPISDSNNPYVPTNSPAVGDLMTMFDFSKQ
jgi:phospholipase C